MSMITELVERLRNCAKWINNVNGLYKPDLLTEAADTIEQLAAKVRAENGGGWIPTAERLPEDKTYVLVTIQIPGRQPHVRSSWYQNGLFMNDNGDVWNKSDLEVKAWKYSPEPYKEEK